MGFQGGQGGRGGYDRGPREMHKAVCADCKKECEVPFKPREDRPVYCKDCFSKHKEQPLSSADDTQTVGIFLGEVQYLQILPVRYIPRGFPCVRNFSYP